MSSASRCDRCGALFEQAPRCVRLDVHVVKKLTRDGAVDLSWEGVDFCPKCSVLVIEVIRTALTGLWRGRRG